MVAPRGAYTDRSLPPEATDRLQPVAPLRRSVTETLLQPVSLCPVPERLDVFSYRLRFLALAFRRLPAAAILAIFFLPNFFLPAAAATAFGFLAPLLLAEAATALNRLPDPNFGFFLAFLFAMLHLLRRRVRLLDRTRLGSFPRLSK